MYLRSNLAGTLYSAINHSRTPRRAIIYTYNPARLGKVNEGRFPNDGA